MKEYAHLHAGSRNGLESEGSLATYGIASQASMDEAFVAASTILAITLLAVVSSPHVNVHAG